jgi:flagellar hook-associated protein 1 FlgK
MAGLFGTLSVALSGLAASQQELETSSNNVANANTPGYSREVSDLEAGAPIVLNSLSIGTGVVLSQVQSLRDPILEIQLNQETQQNSYLNSQLTQLQQIQTGFSSATTGIGADITNFFNSLQQLSPDPTSLALRQSVLTAAGNLATDFNTASTNLATQRGDLDQTVTEDVSQINGLTSQIASVNQQIAELQDTGEPANTLVDQQTNLVRQLSTLVGVQVISTGQGGIEVSTSNGTALVSGIQSFALSTASVNGTQHVLSSSGQDITGTLNGGSLAGTIQIRDQEIPGVLSQLDQLTAGLSSAANAANARGFDLSGAQGGNIFSTPPEGVTGAAGAMQVVMTDPSGIAASSDGTQGSNGNLANLAAVANQQVSGGDTPIDAYSNLVFQIGSATSNTSADADASSQILQQLQDQRGSVSGVSLNEEAANMVQYQSAYQAASRVVSTIGDLLLDAVNLGTGAAES